MDELAENPGAAVEIIRLRAPGVSDPGVADSSFPDPESFGLSGTLSSIGVDWDGFELSEFETYEPLGILVELAKGGKIDPWDIDIVELTDGFLRRVEELKKMDLRISSRTLLYSAILLRMKSAGILDEADGAEEEPDFFDDEDFPEPEEFPIPKLPVRRLATRPVTLNELIFELKKAEKALSRKNDLKARQVSEEPRAPRGPKLSTGDVLGIAHDEAIGVRLELIWARLLELFKTQPFVAFSGFLECSEDQVMDYVSLLFLASSRKVWLCQKELFGELYIYPGEKSGFSTEGNPPFFHETKSGQNGDLLPVEAGPADLSSAGASPADLSPVEASSMDVNSADVNPADVSPVEASPMDANSADASSMDVNSTDVNPVEANPFDE